MGGGGSRATLRATKNFEKQKMWDEGAGARFHAKEWRHPQNRHMRHRERQGTVIIKREPRGKSPQESPKILRNLVGPWDPKGRHPEDLNTRTNKELRT